MSSRCASPSARVRIFHFVSPKLSDNVEDTVVARVYGFTEPFPFVMRYRPHRSRGTSPIRQPLSHHANLGEQARVFGFHELDVTAELLHEMTQRDDRRVGGLFRGAHAGHPGVLSSESRARVIESTLVFHTPVSSGVAVTRHISSSSARSCDCRARARYRSNVSPMRGLHVGHCFASYGAISASAYAFSASGEVRPSQSKKRSTAFPTLSMSFITFTSGTTSA